MTDRLRRTERYAAVFLALTAATAAALFAAGGTLGVISLTSLGALLGFQACIGGVVFLHGRLRRLAAREAEERAAFAARENALFASAEGEAHEERGRALRQFERFGLPLLTVLLAAVAGGLGVWLWVLAGGATGGDTTAPSLRMPVVVALLVAAFVYFLAGKYLVGLARPEACPLLAAPGEQALLAALALAVTGAVGVAANLLQGSETGFPQLAPVIVTRALSLVLAVMALELLLGLLLDFYRPRGSGKAAFRVPVYESRLCRLLTRPGGFVRGVADVLDYQFGFGVSETWLYAFALRSALPLCGLALLGLLVFSCLVSVNPGERAVVETWGKPATTVRGPGISLKWPWPVQRVRRVFPHRIREFTIGVTADAVKAASSGGAPPAPEGMWQNLSAGEDLFLSAGAASAPEASAANGAGNEAVGTAAAGGVGIPAATVPALPATAGGNVPAAATAAGTPAPVALPGGESPPSENAPTIPGVNLLTVGFTIRYEVSNIPDFLYQYADPQGVLASLARREMTAFLATHDGVKLLQEQGSPAVADLQTRLNALAVKLDLGVHIDWVAVSRFQPPGPVVAAFRQVTVATQERGTHVLQAERYAEETVPGAEAAAAERVATANSKVLSKVAQAQAFAALFEQRRKDDAEDPELYRSLRYLNTLEQGLAGLPKIVVGTDRGNQVFEIDLKKSNAPELLNLGKPGAAGE